VLSPRAPLQQQTASPPAPKETPVPEARAPVDASKLERVFTENSLTALLNLGADKPAEPAADVHLPQPPGALLLSSRISDDLPPLPFVDEPYPLPPALLANSQQRPVADELAELRRALELERSNGAQARANLAKAQKVVVEQDARIAGLQADVRVEQGRVQTLIGFVEKAKERIQALTDANAVLERRVKALEGSLDRRPTLAAADLPRPLVAPEAVAVTAIAAVAPSPVPVATTPVAVVHVPPAEPPVTVTRQESKLEFSTRPARPLPARQANAISATVANGRATLEVEQLIELRIVALVGGQSLDWRATRPDEVRHFRAQMSAARAAALRLPAFAEERKAGLVLAAERTLLPVPTSLPKSVQAKFQVTDGGSSMQFSKTVVLALETTTGEAVRSLLAQSQRTTVMGTALQDADFVLQFTGRSDLIPIDDACRWLDLRRVRQCLDSGESTVQLTLTASAALGDRFAAVQRFANSGAHGAVTALPTVGSEQMAESEFDAAFDGIRKAGGDVVAHTDLTLGYRFRVGQLERVPRGVDFVSVRCGLFHSGRALATPTATAVLQCGADRSVQFEEWLYTNVAVAAVPRETRLVIQVLGSKKRTGKDAVVIGGAAMLVVDYRGRFLTGAQPLRLWVGSSSLATGALSENLNARDAMRVAITIDLTAGGSTAPANGAQQSEKAPRVVLFRPLPSVAGRPGGKAEWLDEARAELTHSESLQLQNTLETALPSTLNDAQRALLWRARAQLVDRAAALPLVMASVDWGERRTAVEALRCLSFWARCSARDALQLIGPSFQAAHVRAYAVEILEGLSDSDLELFMPQLVQAMLHESAHLSALALFLLRRALQSRARIGHCLFWTLRAELTEIGNGAVAAAELEPDEDGVAVAREATADDSANRVASRERTLLVLEAYLRACGIDQIESLSREAEFSQQLGRIAALVQEAGKDERAQVLQDELASSPLPMAVTLPTDVTVSVDAFVPEKCKVMDSFTRPLWLGLRNADRLGSPISLIYKAGDDLRQDALAIQVFRLMERIWHEARLDLNLTPYVCVATQTLGGLIEVVPRAETVADIQKSYGGGGASSVFSKTPVAKFLKERNASPEAHVQAVDRFLRTTAASCVATFVLGVGDRHNDNIMVTETGLLFHIDFSKIAGVWQKWNGIKRERAPFVLTPEFVFVFAGENEKDSPNWFRFVDLCTEAYNALRSHWRLFVALFDLMLLSGITNLQRQGLAYLHKSLAIGSSNAEARAAFESLIYASLDSVATRLNFGIHLLANRRRRDISSAAKK
jgi:phosphatidylinositol-4,5-bisphosphate 3-kinase